MGKILANDAIKRAFEFSSAHDVIGAPVAIATKMSKRGAKLYGKDTAMSFFDSVEDTLLQDTAKGWEYSNVNKGALAATAGTAWIAGNAGVGMIKGVFTDRNGNFDMPLVPGI